jgi:hypothetical protein
MDTNHTISEIDGEIARLSQVKELLQGAAIAKIAIWLEISQMKVHRILARHNCQNAALTVTRLPPPRR